MDYYIPPKDEKAEQHIIGAMVLSSQKNDWALLDYIFNTLNPSDFYFENLRKIFEKAYTQHTEGKPIDNVFWDDNSPVVWTTCVNNVSFATKDSVRYHANTIIENAKEREKWKCLCDAKEAHEKGEEITPYLENIKHIDERTNGIEIVQWWEQQIEDEKTGASKTVDTGFSVLDYTLLPLDQRKEGKKCFSLGSLTLIAAPSGQGKTTFLQNIASSTVKHTPTMYLCYEETTQEISARFERLGVEKTALMYYINKKERHIKWLRAVCADMKKKFGFFFLFIDQLSEIVPDTSGKKHLDQSYLYFAEITKQIKHIAQENEAVIFLSHQMNAEGENLAYSTSTMNTPDKVIFLRRERKEENPFSNKQQGNWAEYTDKTFMKVHKNRPTGYCPRAALGVNNGDSFVFYEQTKTLH